MAENENQTTAVEESSQQEEQAPAFVIRVEDAGPATKKVHVEVPKEAVARRISEQYRELRQQALIPGFRKGRVPQKLLEKKFAADVREQVRSALIRESYEQAVEQNNLQVLGEPEFEDADKIKVEEEQPLTYSFSVEIQPEIALPELKGIKVKKPKIAVTDDHVNQAMKNLRDQQGSLIPVEDRGVETGDFLTGDVTVKVDGVVRSNQPGAQLVARPGRIAGLHIADLDAQLAGTKVGETRTVTMKVPDDSPVEGLRGKTIEIDVLVHSIKKLEPAEINQEFLESLGFSTEQELRDALREQMVERIDFDVKAAMRRQVLDHLLSKVEVTLPSKLSDRQTERVISRRAVDLLQRGVPRERIEAGVEHLKAGASDEAQRELKSFFILQKVAEVTGADVTEADLNNRIAMMAFQQGQRPERLKQALAKDGALANLYVSMREEAALDKLLEQAEIEEVEPTAEQHKAVAEAAAPSVGSEGGTQNEPAGTSVEAPAAESPAAEPEAGGESSGT